ncbi:thiamine pyrophosphate-dependent enzyme [Flavobacteriaceae bacterium]|nr:thiamine pyrophosphate-dependent enzyme [Flavobacteriaceae bacterium]
MISNKIIEEALLIRRVEENFLDLFSDGKLNGTVHTSVGQEFSAVAFAGQIKKTDFVFSNHRCHGHYISYTKDFVDLIAELMGKKNGVCGGVGSSQHLQKYNFYSNGIQGGIVPVAAGMGLAQKISNSNNIGLVFIGDGTLGEGVVYETMNMISLLKIPLLIICENNQYAQSTKISDSLAGDILKRAESFGIKTFKGDTWDPESLIRKGKRAIDFVRNESQPGFFLVDTYRLNAHSKGDDDRDPKEKEFFRKKDFLTKFEKSNPLIFKEIDNRIIKKIKIAVNEIEKSEELSINEYFNEELLEEIKDKNWNLIKPLKKRQVKLINNFFHKTMESNKKTVFIGEDILSPYGGAFKVANGLSTNFPDRVFSTPISEAAITGISNGLALSGFKPFLEIMFGDFITLSLDQIINHSSKFFHMYNHKVKCPIVIRTPMGGKRGYGPTHSQTLDRFLIGIDNVKVVALNFMIDPSIILSQVVKEVHPVIVIENKADYGRYVGNFSSENYVSEYCDSEYPVIKIKPVKSKPNLTIVTYGGMLSDVLESIENLFYDSDFKVEIIALTKINPIDYDDIIKSVSITKKIAVIEEGSKIGGISSEIISTLVEKVDFKIQTLKIGSLPVPIASVKSLENQILPNSDIIITKINNTLK